MTSIKIIDFLPKLPDRPIDGHKGTFGKVLVIGGSVGFSGAPALTAKAALRGGSGLVRVAVPKSIQSIVATLDPCYTTIGLSEFDGQVDPKAVSDIASHLPDNDVVAIGPGLGTSQGVKEMILSLIGNGGLKLVIDADGLNTLAKLTGPGGWLPRKKANCILTPHPGEMLRLWNSVFREPMPEDRQQCAVQFAQKTNCIVVLKGTGTVVTDGEQAYINDTGNPGMATGGSGDVLTGVISSLVGQGMELFDAAVLGVFVHGLAGDIVAHHMSPYSLIATDIIDALGEAFAQMTQEDSDDN